MGKGHGTRQSKIIFLKEDQGTVIIMSMSNSTGQRMFIFMRSMSNNTKQGSNSTKQRIIIFHEHDQQRRADHHHDHAHEHQHWAEHQLEHGQSDHLLDVLSSTNTNTNRDKHPERDTQTHADTDTDTNTKLCTNTTKCLSVWCTTKNLHQSFGAHTCTRTCCVFGFCVFNVQNQRFGRNASVRKHFVNQTIGAQVVLCIVSCWCLSVSVQRETDGHTDGDADGYTDGQTDGHTLTDRHTHGHIQTHIQTNTQRQTHRFTGIDTRKDTQTRIHRLLLGGVHCVLRARARVLCMCMCVACAEVSVACCVVVAFVFCVVAECFLSCLGSHAFARHVCIAHVFLPLSCRRKTNSVSQIRGGHQSAATHSFAATPCTSQ